MGNERWILGAGFRQPVQRGDRICDVPGLGQAAGRPVQNEIVADLRTRLQAIHKAEFSVLIPPPIPGLGTAGGFQMMVEDRGSVGLNELRKGGTAKSSGLRTSSRNCAA